MTWTLSWHRMRAVLTLSIAGLLLALGGPTGCSDDEAATSDDIADQSVNDVAADQGPDADGITADTNTADVPPDLAVDVPLDLPSPDAADTAADAVDTSDVVVVSRPEDCANGVDDDLDDAVDCDDTDCTVTPVCTAEICDNAQDDNGDGAQDCFDIQCRSAAVCLFENCTNGKDDNANGDADCADAACAAAPTCAGTNEVCNNGVDDDGDGSVDCRDDDCWSGGGTAVCTNATNTVPCTADGQQCDPAQGADQNGFYCFQPPGFTGEGICYQQCDPEGPWTCGFGTFCVDPVPTDQDPRGVCFPPSCRTPFSADGSECPAGEECMPLGNGYLFCRAVGTAQVGEACGFASDPEVGCAAGLVCGAGECITTCDTSVGTCADVADTCMGVFADVGYGVCEQPCPPFSSGACGAGNACTPDPTGVWVCRPDGGLQEGDACDAFQECGEGLACIAGYCYETCSFYATSRCEPSETCFGFDPQDNFGLCLGTCTSLLPDDCAAPETRCVEASDTESVCLMHAGGAQGDGCVDVFGCGQTLFCDEQTSACQQLCQPFDAAFDTCAAGQACFPANADFGVCYPATTVGTAQGDSCSPQGVLCDDAVICGPAAVGSTCYQTCRLTLSDSSGANNADCANTTDVCSDTNGWEGLGLCVAP